MKKIYWLHYSDLHLNDTGVETNRLRQKLPEYLRSLNLHCDYAFFTGDIRRARLGDFPENAAEYLKTAAASVNVPKENIFIVPGNHDLDRHAKERQETVQRIWNAADWSGYYDFSQGRIEQKDQEIIGRGQEKFRQIISDIYQEESRTALYESPCFWIETEHLNVIHLDSTITQGEGQDRDFVIGTENLQKVLMNMNHKKPSVLLTHYSFDYFHRNEQNMVAPMLQDYGVQLWIAGHEHDHLCRKQRDYFYELQTGNIVNENGALSCVLIGCLDLDTGEGEVRCHAYFPRGGWAAYPFIRTGHADNSVYPFRINLPRQGDFIDASQEEIHVREFNASMERGGGLFYNVNIQKQLLPDVSLETNTFENDGAGFSLLDAMEVLWQKKKETGNESCHALLLGDGGMGKSTLLFYSCKELLKKHRLTVYVSLQMLQSMDRGIESHILNTLYQSDGNTAKNRLNDLLVRNEAVPSLVLFVDGFNELTSEKAYQYARELKNLAFYPGIQIIVSSRLDFLKNYGMSHFQMLHTCNLRDEQVKTLFKAEEWQEILEKRHLHVLLGNPMMALLYAQASPVIEKYQDLSFCEWRIPVGNETDILHNYYMAQVALILERGGTGYDIFHGLGIVKYILPHLAYEAEIANVMGWKEEDFEQILEMAVSEVSKKILGKQLPDLLRRVKRQYGLRLEEHFSEDTIYQMLVNVLCLLRSDRIFLRFQHQIYRDYLAAVYLFDELDRSEVCELWKAHPIQAGVSQYLRHMSENLWGESGFAVKKLEAYRHTEIAEGDYYVRNILNCWLTEETEYKGERDLSGLDLRNISLSEQLKKEFQGTISIDGCKVAKTTFVNDRRHDSMIALAFSHDGQTLAAVSQNGMVSVSNLLTQSQMIVGQFTLEEGTTLGFTAEDVLVMQTGAHIYQWPTISYDRVIEKEVNHAVKLEHDWSQGKAGKLYKLLEDSENLGTVCEISDDEKWLAVGFSNGLLQVWDTEQQVTVAELSLGDGQVISAAFSPNGELAALTAGGTLVQIWNVKEQRLVRNLRFSKPVRRVRFPAALDFQAHPVVECEASNKTFVRINLKNLENKKLKNQQQNLIIQKNIRKQLENKKIYKIDMADNGNAVVQLKNSINFYVWNHETRALNLCTGHTQPVKDAAICKADARYAASYSDERIRTKGNAKHLNGQKVVRVWAVRKGNCMQRLSTNQRTIRKLQFFTTNRILLAGFATNGDILLWELHNRKVQGEEWGHWDPINIVTKSPAEPLECAVSTDVERFIGVYADGTIFSRRFSGADDVRFQVFPGIDLTPLRWNRLEGDASTIQVLQRYQK